jgi:hypothetical protein
MVKMETENWQVFSHGFLVWPANPLEFSLQAVPGCSPLYVGAYNLEHALD